MTLIKNERGATTSEIIDFVLEQCCNCGTPFFIPKMFQKQLVSSQDSFYCPAGHSQSYCGKTEAQKLKEELDAEKRKSQRDLEYLNNSLSAEVNRRKKIEKDLKRLNKGVCACCNRSFENLQRHMKTKHPELL